jgi:hypothetical protein
MILSILGGLSAFGFIGIVLGPLVASVLTALVESYVESPSPAPAAQAAAGDATPASEARVAEAVVGAESESNREPI